ncbi:hypothetical protein Tco_0388926 [Tanacetum coccineum]
MVKTFSFVRDLRLLLSPEERYGYSHHFVNYFWDFVMETFDKFMVCNSMHESGDSHAFWSLLDIYAFQFIPFHKVFRGRSSNHSLAFPVSVELNMWHHVGMAHHSVFVGSGPRVKSCTKSSNEMIPCTIKGKPLVLPWGRTPRLDSGVRACLADFHCFAEASFESLSSFLLSLDHSQLVWA